MVTRRIQVYADAETKRRIELAAAKHNVPVTAYCLAAIMQQMSEDQVLEQEQIEIQIKPTAQTVDTQFLAQMRMLRERIKARRGGNVSTDIVEQVRTERDEELLERISG
jgi:hypothetical protein